MSLSLNQVQLFSDGESFFALLGGIDPGPIFYVIWQMCMFKDYSRPP